MQVTRTILTTEEVLTQYQEGRTWPWRAWLASSPGIWCAGSTKERAIAAVYFRHGLVSAGEATLMAEQKEQRHEQ